MVAFVAAALVVVALRSDQPRRDPPPAWAHPARAPLPAARRTDLRAAAAVAGCDLRFTRGAETDVALRRPDLPPTFGPPVPRAAHPGVYLRALAPSELIGALRRGTVVLQFARRMPDAALVGMRAVHDERPAMTILAPASHETRVAVAATAWRRSLACPDFDAATADAVRAFRARYAGSGPEGP